MRFFDRFLSDPPSPEGPRPAYFNAHLKNSDVFECMKYAPSLAALRQTAIPTIIGFRIKQGGPIPPSLTDPRPSFAILETDVEIASWQKVFEANISYEADINIVKEELDLHRLVNFHKPIGTTYETVSEKPLLRVGFETNHLILQALLRGERGAAPMRGTAMRWPMRWSARSPWQGADCD